jgi:molecular chaperone HscB
LTSAAWAIAARARHLLGLRGVVLSESGSTMSTEFLMEQMQWREALDEARAARDLAGLNRLQAEVRERASLLESRMARELDELNDNDAAARTVRQLMFLEKLGTALDDALCELEG